MKNKILIAGHYGFGNVGDEAILCGMLRELNSIRSDLSLNVISGDPSTTTASFDVKSVHWLDIEAIAQAVRETDLVLLGGGGLFHDYWGCEAKNILSSEHHGLTYFAGIPLLAFLHNKPLMLYSVGIGPLLSPDAIRLAKMSVGLANRVTVRDQYSYDYLVETVGAQSFSSTDFEIVSDPAVSMRKLNHSESIDFWETIDLPTNKPYLGVALRQWDLSNRDDSWTTEISAALNTFIEIEDFHVLLFCFQRSKDDDFDDALFAGKIAAQVVRADSLTILDKYIAPAEMLDLVGRCSLFLGMRLHSILFALMCGVPIVGIDYDPKIRELMRAVGSEHLCLSLKQLTREKTLHALHHVLETSDKNLVSQAETNLEPLGPKASKAAISLLGSTPVFHPRAVRIAHELLTENLIADGQIKVQLRESMNREASSKQKIVSLSAKLLDSDQEIESLNDMLFDSDQEVETLKAKILDSDQAIESLNAELLDSNHKIKALIQDMAQLQKKLEAIHLSRYWRVMSVYWRARNLGGTLFRNSKRVGSAVRRSISRLISQRGRINGFRKGFKDRFPSYTVEPGWPVGCHHQSNLDILIFPIIEWDFRFQRPQQIAKQFSRNGHRVFYLSSRFESNGFIRWCEVEPGIFEIRIPGPPDVSIYRDQLDKQHIDGIEDVVAYFSHIAGMNEAICIVQLPFWRTLVKRLRERMGWQVVYDCMDEHSGFDTKSDRINNDEDTLIKQSDLILASSSSLVKKCSLNSDSVFYVPNAVEESFLNMDSASLHILHEMNGIPHPVIGYVGAISSWFDFDLIRETASAHPEWSFVLIGSEWGSDPHGDLQRMGNIHFLGEQSYEMVPSFIASFDVCIIPFKINILTKATDPVKLYEYLALGKPVVASNLPELPDDERLVRRAESASEFCLAIESALTERTLEFQEMRRQFASNNTWETRHREIQTHIRALYPRTSIIVPTWNNLKMTQTFVEGLFHTTNYPDLEILFIDNASEDGTAKYLFELAKQDSRAHLIMNEKNAGFPAAVNQGIQNATGEFLFILNNDVIPTHGWLSKLLRVLYQDLSIGLVGPVSNSVGNEAFVDLQYKDNEEMNYAAFEYARQYIGEVISIPMLAMFCVGGRKEVFEKVGLLDERFGVGMFEDDDYAIRVRQAGFRVVCARDVFVHHVGSASFNMIDEGQFRDHFQINKKLFENKWGIRWEKPMRRDLDHIRAMSINLLQILQAHSSAPRVALIVEEEDASSKKFTINQNLIEDLRRKNFLTLVISKRTKEQALRKIHGSLYYAALPKVVYESIDSPIVFGLSRWPELKTSLRSPEIPGI